ncbi:MAG: lactate racemase domain-containing protein [Candidatus Thorarchaeota archaeon]|jgi:nickel-dependent lactate racemase
MRIDLRYGEGSLKLENGTLSTMQEIAPKTAIGHTDLEAELGRVLMAPIGSEALPRAVSREDSVVVVVEGPVLHTYFRTLVEATLSNLSGILEPEQITIIVSSGNDGPADPAEWDTLLGAPTSRGHSLIIHDSRREDQLEEIGTTPTHSTPVQLNQHFIKADFKIGVGSILPSVFTGVTGGRMAVVPGVAGVKTISRNLKLIARDNFSVFDVTTSACLDMEEACSMAGLNFILNSVEDWKGTVAEVVAGSSPSSWGKGVSTARNLANVPLEHRYDVAVVSAGGFPNDSTLYSAVEALGAGFHATRRDGVIMLVAECSRGVGPGGFLSGVSLSGSERDILPTIETDFELGMERARYFLRVLESRKLILCSRLRSSLVEEHLHCMPVRSPEEGLEVARELTKTRARIAAFADGTRTHTVTK